VGDTRLLLCIFLRLRADTGPLRCRCARGRDTLLMSASGPGAGLCARPLAIVSWAPAFSPPFLRCFPLLIFPFSRTFKLWRLNDFLQFAPALIVLFFSTFAISPHSFKPSGCFCLLLCVWVRLTAALFAVALGAHLLAVCALPGVGPPLQSFVFI
jgi:hypothetical protein